MDRKYSYNGFWADVRRDYAALWQEIRSDCRAAREQWWEMVAQIREDRHWTRRLKQVVTGVENPTRKQFRDVSRVMLSEAKEIEEAERRVLREFGQDAL
jgi:hypothetical protein